MNIAVQRLYNQRLEGQKFETPAEVVGWLGAVQAQEYALAKWALGLRMKNATDEVIERAFDEGAILRTHVMRPTWHFVAPDDIRWIQGLTAPRVHARNAYYVRQLGLDDTMLRRSNDTIVKALEGGKHLTRAELGTILAETGIDTSSGMRLGYVVHHAELECIVCSGPRRGKQHTYALVDERAPQAKSMPHDEALAELTKRYFTSHGPATLNDYAWWSGLTVADGKAGLAMLGSQFVSETIDGKTYWFSSSMPEANAAPMTAHLLPVYDEFGIAYKHHGASLDSMYNEQVQNRFFTSAFAVEGQIIAMWRRTFSKKLVVVEVGPFRPFSPAEQDAFVQAAQSFGEFLGMEVRLA